jgi:hypothetical protein
MTHHVKLVKGDNHTTMEKAPKKKNIVSLTVTLSDKELTQMKALTGLRGKVRNSVIIKEYIKQKFQYGW